MYLYIIDEILNNGLTFVYFKIEININKGMAYVWYI